jgi:YD repeat-containing protein
MSAVISGNGLGLFNTSYTQIGAGSGSDARLGQWGDSQFVNIKTGNLLLQNVDEQLLFRGSSIGFARTYNSAGTLSQVGQDGWTTGFERNVELSSGTLNVSGSVMRRYAGDGSYQDFTYVSANKYQSTTGSDAHDTLTWNSTARTWTYLEGSSRHQETYADHASATLKGRLTQVRELKSDGTAPTTWLVNYDAGNRVSEVRADDGGATGDALIYTYDVAGRLQTISTREGGVVRGQVTYEYDAANRLTAVTVDLTPDDAAGDSDVWNATTAANNDGRLFRTVYTYVDTTSLRIATVQQSDGSISSYTYDVSGRVATVTIGDTNTNDADGAGQTTTFSYNTVNRTADITDPSGRIWSYLYDTSGQLIQVKSPAVSGLRNTTDYVYDASGNVTSVTTSRASVVLSKTAYAYDASGNVTWQWDTVDGGQATAISRTYTATNQIASETRYTGYDADGAGSASVPAAATGLTTRYLYDAQDRVKFQIDPAGNVTEWTYAATGNGIGQLTSTRRYLGAAYTSSTYTLAALSSWATTAQKANSTLVEQFYDLQGRLSESRAYTSVNSAGDGVADDAATITNYVYDAQGLLRQQIANRSSTAAAGDGRDSVQVVEYVYDGMGRLLSTAVRERIGAGSFGTLSSATWAYLDSGRTLRCITEGGAVGDGVTGNDLLRIEVRDAAGQLVSVSESAVSGGATRTSHNYYDSRGLLRAQEDASGARVYYFYDENGWLAGEVDQEGTLTEYERDGAGRVLSRRTHATRVDTTSWISAGAVTPQTVAQVRPAWTSQDRGYRYVYDIAGRLKRESTELIQVDLAGVPTFTTTSEAKVKYYYDGAGRLTKKVETRNESESLGSGIDSPTFVYQYFYDANGGLVGETDGDGYLSEYQYDRAGRMVKEIRYSNSAVASGTSLDTTRPALSVMDQVTRYFYDGQGNRIGELDAESYLTQYLFDAAGNSIASRRFMTALTGLSGSETLSALLLAAGSGSVLETRRTFDAQGRLSKEINTEGSTTAYDYDAQGNLVRVRSGIVPGEGADEPRESNRRYDVFCNVVAELAGVGSALITPESTQQDIDDLYASYGTKYEYDALNRLTTATDAHGNATWYFYDAAGRQRYVVRGVEGGAGISNAQGEVTETRYTAFGEIQDVTTYTGRIALQVPGSRASAAAALSTLSYASAIDSRSQYLYDSHGWMTQSIDAEGNSVKLLYNYIGQLQTRKIQVGSEWISTSYNRDRAGRVTREVDGDSLTPMEDGEFNIRNTYAYDAFGRLITHTDGLGNTTEFAYDRLGRQVSQQRTVSGRLESSSYSYDAIGRALTLTDAVGSVTTYAYDDASRSVLMTSAEGVAVTTRHNAFGETVSIEGGESGQRKFQYDQDGHLASSVGADGNQSYYYDERGLLVETYKDGRITTFDYDAAGRVVAKTQDPEGLSLTTHYAYDGQGRTLRVTDPGGAVTAMKYDRKGQLVESAQDPDGLNLRTTYSWDARGLQLSVVRGAGSAAAERTDYAYDRFGRLITQTVAAGSLDLATTYRYDNNDNVVMRTGPDGSVEYYAYDEANRRIFTVAGDGGVTRNYYDTNGRLVAVRSYATKMGGFDPDPAPLEAGQIEGSVSNDDAHDLQSFRVYNDDGNLAYAFDGAGAVQEMRYDGNGRVIRTTRYANATPLTPSLLSKLYAGSAEASDFSIAPDVARDETQWSVYDTLGRLVYTVDSTGALSEIVYGAAGDIVARRGITARVELDEVGGSATITARAALNQGISSDSFFADYYYGLEYYPLRETAFTYDGAGRLIYEVTIVSSGQLFQSVEGAVKRYTYDDSSRIVAETLYAETITPWSGNSFVGMSAEDIEDSLQSGEAEPEQRTTRYVYDDAGRQRFVIDPLGAITEQRFDAANQVIETRQYGDLRPSASSDEAALSLELAAVTNFRKTSQIFDAAGRITEKTDALNHHDSFVYDGAGRVLSRTNRDGAVWTYEYDAAGRKIKETSPQVSVASVDTSGNMTTTMRAIVTSTVYDGLGNVLSLTEDFGGPKARTTEYAYDNRGHQIRTTFPDAGALDASGNLVATGVRPTVEVTYNALGQAVMQKDVRGHYSYKTYDAMGRVEYEVDQTGGVTKYGYSVFGEQSSVVRYSAPVALTAGQPVTSAQLLPQIGTSASTDRLLTIIYDAAGRKIDVRAYAPDDLASAYKTRTVFTYNAYGELAREATMLRMEEVVGTFAPQSFGDEVYDGDEDWAFTYHYYDDAGQETLTVDPAGYCTTLEYTAFGEVSQRTELSRALDLQSSEETLSIDDRPTLPAPGNASIGYDRVTRWTYDAIGRKSSETVVRHFADGVGTSGVRDVVTGYTYDNEGHALVVDVDGQATTSVYDAIGRLVSVKEAQRAVLRSDADSLLVASTANSLAGMTLLAQASPYSTMAYDAFGNVVQVRSYANGWRSGDPTPVASTGDLIHSTRYDWQGRNVWERDVMGTVYRRKYDAADHVTESSYRLDGNGDLWSTVTSAYTYDDVGRQITSLTTRDRHQGATSLGSSYESSERVAYNAFGEIVAKDARLDPELDIEDFAAQYRYDALGNLRSSNAGDGIWRNYEYDNAGRQVAEWHRVRADSSLSTTVIARTTSELDAIGRVVVQYRPSTASEIQLWEVHQKYDRWGNVTEIRDARGATTNYEYNELNQAVREIQPTVKIVTSQGTESNGRPENRWYYDALGRLVGTRDANGNNRRSQYDATGRLTSTIDGTGSAMLMAYDTLGRQVLTQDALGYISFRDFDKAGRVVAQGDYLSNVTGSSTARVRKVREQYQLDQNGNRLAVTDAASHVARYEYDSRGKLLWSRTAEGVTVSYAYDSNGNKIRETNALSDPGLIGGSTARRQVTDREDETVYLDEQTWDYDYFNRLVDHNDLGGADYDYTYDPDTGQLTAQTVQRGLGSGFQSLIIDTPDDPGEIPDPPAPPGGTSTSGNRTFFYYPNGQLHEIREATAAGDNWTRYTYDASGNRTSEETLTHDANGQTLHLRTTTTYDSHNRISRVIQDDIGSARRMLDMRYSYDAAGNRSHVEVGTSFNPAGEPPDNAGFEDGDNDWTKGQGWSIVEESNGGDANTGSWSARYDGSNADAQSITNNKRVAVIPGQSVSASVMVQQGGSSAGDASARVLIIWYDANGVPLPGGEEHTYSGGNIVSSGSNGEWKKSSRTATVPPGAAFMSIAASANKHAGGFALFVDDFQWSYQADGNDGELTVDQSYWYDYDGENRITVANGQLVNGQVVVGNDDVSFALSYDEVGHATQRRFYEDGVLKQQNTLYTERGERSTVFQATTIGNTAPLVLAESFDYDDVGRQTEHRTYDDAGLLKHLDSVLYDSDGRVDWSASFGRSIDGTGYDEFPEGEGLAFLSKVTYYDPAATTHVGAPGYDAAGRVQGYSYYLRRNEVDSGANGSTPQDYVHYYSYQYEGRDSYLETQVAGTSTNNNFKASTSRSTYDDWGRRIAIREQTPGARLADRIRYFSYDEEGNILRRREGTLDSGVFTQDTLAEAQTELYAYVNGQTVASGKYDGTLDILGRQTAYDTNQAGATKVTVQAGDTLRSIAQRVYGNASLWYVLANANAMSDDSELSAGATLNVPNVNVSANDAATFKPFNANEAIGSTSPSLPYIMPPPKQHCKALSRVISVVVNIVVSYYAGSAAGGAAGNLAYQGTQLMFNNQYDWGRLVKFVANPFAGNSEDLGRAIYDPLGNGAPGKIDYEQVGISAAASYLGSEAGSTVGSATNNAFLGAATNAAVSYSTSYTINRALGNDPTFNLRQLGAGIATAVAAQGVSQSLGVGGQQSGNATLREQTFSWRQVVADALSGVASYGIQKSFGLDPEWDPAGIAADAFGNAIGNQINYRTSMNRAMQQSNGPSGRTAVDTRASEVSRQPIDVPFLDFEVDDLPFRDEWNGTASIITAPQITGGYDSSSGNNRALRSRAPTQSELAQLEKMIAYARNRYDLSGRTDQAALDFAYTNIYKQHNPYTLVTNLEPVSVRPESSLAFTQEVYRNFSDGVGVGVYSSDLYQGYVERTGTLPATATQRAQRQRDIYQMIDRKVGADGKILASVIGSTYIAGGLGAAATLSPLANALISGYGAGSGVRNIYDGNYVTGTLELAGSAAGFGLLSSQLRSTTTLKGLAWAPLEPSGLPSQLSNRIESWDDLIGAADGTPARTFSNLFPEDVPRMPNVIPNDRLLTMSRKNLAYVVKEDGTLVVGRNNQFQGHIDLAGGDPVLAAGELRIHQGKIIYIDNYSGHYRPSGIEAQRAAENAFLRIGFDVDGTYVERPFK